MNRTRLAKKWSWTPSRERRELRRDDRYWGDYWACVTSGYTVPGRLLAVSKLRGRKAGAR